MTTAAQGINPIPVHIVNPPPEKKREIVTVFRTVHMDTVAASLEGAVLIAPHSPNRLRVTITTVFGGFYCIIAGSAPDAKNKAGMWVDCSRSPVIELCGTDEIWIGQGTLPTDPNNFVSAAIEYLGGP